MHRLGPWEIALIVLGILIVFGAGKLPSIFKSIGDGLRGLRRLDSDDEVKG